MNNYQGKSTNHWTTIFYIAAIAFLLGLAYQQGLLSLFLDNGSSSPVVIPTISGGEPEITVYDGPAPILRPIEQKPSVIGGVPGDPSDLNVGGGTPNIVVEPLAPTNIQPLNSQVKGIKPESGGVMGQGSGETKGDK